MPLTKNSFRQICLEKIKNMPQHNIFYKNALLHKALLEEIGNVKNAKILLFHPMGHEPNILKLLAHLRKKNQIFVPFMEGKSFKMVPFRLPLKQKRFGIFEAGNTIRNINKVDLAIVPAVGVDGNLQRVGFGKGMYDRFFAKLKKRPYTIFIQPKICYTHKNICDEYDIQCDLLLTPKVKLVNKRA